ncbi:MAG TPA: hypothetical protein VHB73_06570, partial [Alphaproteobacteria bacterium]|nr:hypothetical protein [Alphaproteobacteria bacterium]
KEIAASASLFVAAQFATSPAPGQNIGNPGTDVVEYVENGRMQTATLPGAAALYPQALPGDCKWNIQDGMNYGNTCSTLASAIAVGRAVAQARFMILERQGKRPSLVCTPKAHGNFAKTPCFTRDGAAQAHP